MRRKIDPDFIRDYAASNPDCEIAPYFKVGGEVVYVYETGQRIEQVLFGRRMPKAEQVHHVCGSGNGAQRHDVLTNVVHVSLAAHDWLERHKIAGFVLCCWHKSQKGELDWTELSSIKGRPGLPRWFETDQVIECCRAFPAVERARRRFVG